MSIGTIGGKQLHSIDHSQPASEYLLQIGSIESGADWKETESVEGSAHSALGLNWIALFIVSYIAHTHTQWSIIVCVCVWPTWIEPPTPLPKKTHPKAPSPPPKKASLEVDLLIAL